MTSTLLPLTLPLSYLMLWAQVVFVARCNAAGDNANLALNRPTAQSSSHSSTGASQHAVDGDRNPFFIAGHCIHTGWDFPTWWLVDLQENYVISYVQITNRDGSWHRLANFSVEVSLDHPSLLSGFPGETQAPVCFTELEPLGRAEIKLYRCQAPLWGRYLRVVKYSQTPDDRVLQICEFEVFGPGGRYESSSRSALLPEVLESASGVVSNVACATLCSQRVHVGRMCESFQRHTVSGECQLMGSRPGSDQVADPDWDTYEMTSE